MASEASQLTLRAKDAFESAGWRPEVIECRIWGLGLIGSGMWGLGFRFWGFMVWGLGYRVWAYPMHPNSPM